MPLQGGPKIIGKENLVFAFDTGDADNSFKGQPGTNITTGANKNYVGYSLSTFSNGKLFEANGYTENVFIGSIYAAITIFIFYLTHPLNYIDQYFIEGISPILLGAYNFPIPSKIIDIFFSYDISSGVSKELLVPGVYLTLPGSLYVDFGYFGAMMSGSGSTVFAIAPDRDRSRPGVI
jgi:hypothetical protein